MSEYITDASMIGFVIGLMTGMVVWELFVSFATKERPKKDDNEQ